MMASPPFPAPRSARIRQTLPFHLSRECCTHLLRDLTRSAQGRSFQRSHSAFQCLLLYTPTQRPYSVSAQGRPFQRSHSVFQSLLYTPTQRPYSVSAQGHPFQRSHSVFHRSTHLLGNISRQPPRHPNLRQASQSPSVSVPFWLSPHVVGKGICLVLLCRVSLQA